MRSIVLAGCSFLLLAPLPARAATYYVATTGSDSNPGTEAQPFATIARGQTAASAGDTVLIRGGEYTYAGDLSVGVSFDKSGSASQHIKYWAYPGEKPIFDFFGMNAQARLYGFRVQASWLHFRGLELRGVQQILTTANESWCIRLENGSSNNVFENLDLHHNEGPGLFIAAGSNNLVLNVDSHDNYDPDRNGENSDGFGCHTTGAGNVFRGCRAWWNSDDGFDFINSPGVCTVEHSWAFLNGYRPGTTTAAGNGAGIKAGGFGLDTGTFPATIPRHVVRFNVAWGNRGHGFYANHHPGGIDWTHNTAFDNPNNFNLLADVGAAAHLLRNNLAAGTGTALAAATQSEIDDDGNSWSLPVTVSSADFDSVSDATARGPRQADGSLPSTPFLHLAAGSDLIDRGADVGSSFAGAAPDLGAFEFGAPSAGTSGGGAAGSSGAAGGGGLAAGAAGAGNAGSPPIGGAGNAGGASTSGGAASAPGSGAGSAGAPTAPGGDEGGCACSVLSTPPERSTLAWLGALVAALFAGRRAAGRRSD